MVRITTRPQNNARLATVGSRGARRGAGRWGMARYAPLELTTARAVRSMMARSCMKDQLST